MCSLASSWLLTNRWNSVASIAEQTSQRLGQKEQGLFHYPLLKTSGFSGNMQLSFSTRIDSDLALRHLLKNSGGAKSGLLNFSRSTIYLKAHIPKKHWKGKGWKEFWKILTVNCFLLTPFTLLPVCMLQACSTTGTVWRGCCSWSSIQHMGRTDQGPGAEGLQKQLAGWADLIELTLPPFSALTFAEGCCLL